MTPKAIYEQIDPHIPFYPTDRLEDGRVCKLSTKTRDFVEVEPVFGPRKCNGGVWFDSLGGLGGLCSCVVVANGMSDDEVYKRTDADPGTTEDHDNVRFDLSVKVSDKDRA